jgi:hypothetical protein
MFRNPSRMFLYPLARLLRSYNTTVPDFAKLTTVPLMSVPRSVLDVFGVLGPPLMLLSPPLTLLSRQSDAEYAPFLGCH